MSGKPPGSYVNLPPLDLGDWRENAACLFTDPEIFYPADMFSLIAARTICEGCQVRRACLRDGLEDHHGIWGGFTPEERRELRKQLRSTKPEHRTLLINRSADLGPSN